MTLRPASAVLAGVPLSGVSPIVWRFTEGVAPYQTTVAVPAADAGRLEAVLGQPVRLDITDSRGVSLGIEQVYVLHRAPSDSPARATFVVSDRRWLWPYPIVIRDFNVPRKTGNRTGFADNVPVESLTTVDLYDYLAHTLKADGTRWTAREALVEVLGAVVGSGFRVESFPFGGSGPIGEFPLQNVQLRDPGSAAISRFLQYVPGVGIFVQADGIVTVYDTTDRGRLRAYLDALPVETWAGESVTWIDRKYIRPRNVHVYFQREIEVPLKFEDDYAGQTRSIPPRNSPFLENVLPTVDPITTLVEFDPETGRESEKRVPPGTWVEVSQWLAAMDADRPTGSMPWTFETIREHWVGGDLDGVLGAGGLDLDEDANVALRVQALKQHFRQTFRISRRYALRARSIRAIRVAVLDPVTGARAPAAAWSQACIVPSTKGKTMAARGNDPDKNRVFRNVDYLAPSRNGAPLIETAPGPTAVSIIDEDLGIFRLDWIASPYGDVERFYPCNLVDDNNRKRTITRDMSLQDTDPVVANARVENGTNGIFLAHSLEARVVLTMVPSAPNDERQFHRVTVGSDTVAGLFNGDTGIAGGNGPDISIFVPPGDATALYALTDVDQAEDTIRAVIGLEGSAPDPGDELPGYILANDGAQSSRGSRHLEAFATAVAVEVLVAFNDALQGSMATRLPDNGVRLVGNTASVSVRAAAAPSGKIDTVHEFPGQARPLPRYAVLPEATRTQILGTLPFTT